MYMQKQLNAAALILCGLVALYAAGCTTMQSVSEDQPKESREIPAGAKAKIFHHDGRTTDLEIANSDREEVFGYTNGRTEMTIPWTAIERIEYRSAAAEKRSRNALMAIALVGAAVYVATSSVGDVMICAAS